MKRFRIPPRRIPRTGDDSPARSVLHYVWRMSGHHQVWISLIALAIAALSMAPLELQRRIINDAIGNGDIPLLAWLGGAYLVVILVEAGAKFVLHVYQGWLSESAIRYNREHLARLQVEGPNDLAARNGGDAAERSGDDESEHGGRAVAIINAEIDKLGGFVGEGISEPVANAGVFVAIIGYMLAVEPSVALVALAFLAPQAALVPWLQRMINRLIERRLGLLRDLSDNIVERSESEPSRRDQMALLRDLDSIYDNRMRIFVIKFLMKSSTNLLSALAPLTVLMVGGYFVLQDRTTVGVVVAFMTGFHRLADPLRDLLAYYRVAAQATVQHRMIAAWM